MNLAAGKEQAAAARESGLAPLAALLLACLIGGSVCTTACGAGQLVTDTGGKIVDCAKLDEGQLATLGTQLARSVATYVVAGTPIDWDAIEAQAEAAGLVIGGCVLGPLVASRGPSSSSAPAHAAAATAPPSNDAARAWASFARLKGKAGVTTYQTSAGPL
jgi:hypothetical protein